MSDHHRRYTTNPEIVTYDELLERARYMMTLGWYDDADAAKVNLTS